MSDLPRARIAAAAYMDRAAKIAEAEEDAKLAESLRKFADVLREKAHGADGPTRD